MKCSFLCAVFICILVLSGAICIPVSANSPPTVVYKSCGSTRHMWKNTYLFIVRYSDPDGNAPAYINLVLDNRSYGLTEVDTGDTNYTDGKDYYITLDIKKGVHVYYFIASDGNNETRTPALLLNVGGFFSTQHGDINLILIVLAAIILPPLIYLCLLLRRMTHILAEGRKKEKE